MNDITATQKKWKSVSTTICIAAMAGCWNTLASNPSIESIKMPFRLGKRRTVSGTQIRMTVQSGQRHNRPHLDSSPVQRSP